MIWLIFIILMGVLARLSGNGFGQKWGVSWLPELIHSIPYGVALGWASSVLGADFFVSLILTATGTAVSYAGMQSATWMFLQWEKHNANDDRESTLRFIVDRIAGHFGYKLGDEGYSWFAAGVKGFIIGLPVGGILTAALWPLGYEIGSHAKGRVDKFIDPHAISEFMSGLLGGLSIVIFCKIIMFLTGV